MNEGFLRKEVDSVAFFVFNRPQLTAGSYERIRAARPKRLFVVADGPRPHRPNDVALCQETRKIVSSPDWPCDLHLNYADENLGCRRRISSGLDWVFEQCPETIIVEDDCLPAASFFPFCSTLLEKYRDDERVMSIGGGNFQCGQVRGSGSYYFSAITHIVAWATWRRAWRHIDIQLASWPAARKEGLLSSVLSDPMEVQYWTEIMEKTFQGRIDSWGYPWLYSCWAQRGLCAVPNRNLVTTLGTGPDATHTNDNISTLGIPVSELTECVHPETVERDRAADRFHWEQHLLHDFRRELNSRKWHRRLRKKLGLRTRIRELFRGERKAWNNSIA